MSRWKWQREVEITTFLSLLPCDTSVSVKKTDNVKLLLILVSEYTKLLIFCFVFVCVIFNSPCNLGLLQEFWKTFIMNMTWISFIVPLWVVISIENGSKEEIFHKYSCISSAFNPLSANPTKWSHTLNNSSAICWQIAWKCLTNLWGWCLKG